MIVSFTSELEKFVVREVESGRYNSAGEVMREVTRLFKEHNQARGAQIAAFNHELGQRLTALDRGDTSNQSSPTSLQWKS